MSWALLGLLSGFIAVLLMLSYLLLQTDLALKLKTLAVVVVSLFYWVQYESLQQYTGWPSNDDLPEKFVLISAHVQEPSDNSRGNGVMYWWVRDSAQPDSPPRVFELPYKAEMHQKVAQIVEEQKKGSVYVGRKSAQGAAGPGEGIRFEKISKASRYQKKKD